MSKRQLQGPHADRSQGIDFSMSSTPDDKPQRATAAQLANRKIKALNRRTRPNTASTSAAPQSFGPFNSIDPNTVSSTTPSPNPGLSNGFTFGQSQSFPGAGSNSTQNGTQPITFGSGGPSGFNFSTSFDSGAAVSNPFANLNGTGQSRNQPAPQNQNQNPPSTGFGGFKGSIFNIPPATNPNQNQPSPAPSSGNLFGFQTSQNNNTGTGLFSSPSNSTTSASSTPIFQTTPATTAGTGSIFGRSTTTQASTPSFNLTNTDTSKTTSLFGQAPASTESPKNQTLFGAASDTMQTSPDTKAKTGISKPGVSTTTPASQSLFGSASNATGSPTKSLFGAPGTETKNPFLAAQTSTSLFGAKTETSADTAGKSLFDRVTKPSDTAASTVSAPAKPIFGTGTPLFGQTKPTDTPAFGAGSSLFGQTKPTEPATTSAPSVATPAFGASSSLFGRVTKPSDTEATSAPTEAKPIFGTGTPLFGQTKPADTTASTAPAFGAGASLFGQTKPTENAATSAPPAAPAFGSGGSLFGRVTTPSDAPAATAAPLSTTNAPSAVAGSIFGQPAKPSDTPGTSAPSAADATAKTGNFLFGQSKTSDTQSQPFQSLFPSPSKAESPKPLFMPGKEASTNILTPKPAVKVSESTTTTAASAPEKNVTPKPSFGIKGPRKLPPNLNKLLATDVDLIYKLHMLNESFKKRIVDLDPVKDSFDTILLFYMRVRETIGVPLVPGKRKDRDEEPGRTDISQPTWKRAKTVEASQNVNNPPASASPLSSAPQPTITSPNKRKASEEVDSGADAGGQGGKRAKAGSSSGSETASIFASSFSSSKATESGAESLQKTQSPAAAENGSAPTLFKPTISEASKATTPGFKPFQSTSATTSAGPFSLSPSPTTDKETEATAKPTFQPPKFGTGNASNFLAQFGQKAAKEAEKEREKRKAEDFDSDEDDEAEWEKKDAEEQRKKRRTFEDIAKKRTKFVPGKGFVIEDDVEQNPDKAGSTTIAEPKPTSSAQSSAENGAEPKAPTPSSIFENQRSTPPITSNNLFGHLSAANSSAEASGEDESDEDAPEEAAPAAPATPSASNGGGGSLFDRIQYGNDGKPLREESENDKAGGTQSASSTNAICESITPQGFGSFNSAGPAVGPIFPATFASSSTPSYFTPAWNNGNSFGGHVNSVENPGFGSVGNPVNSFGNHGFGSVDNPVNPFETPGFGSVGNSVDSFGNPDPTSSPWCMQDLITAADSFPIATPSMPQPFSNPQPSMAGPFANPFGTPVGFATNQGGISSGFVSNSDTGAEDTDGGDGEYSNDPQVDLMGSAGEENETAIFVARSRALKYQRESWETQGVGPLKVLVNQYAGRARVVLRADPSGKVVLNTAIQKGISYKVANNSVQFVVPRVDGSGMDLWALRVKTMGDAQQLAQALTQAQSSLR